MKTRPLKVLADEKPSRLPSILRLALSHHTDAYLCRTIGLRLLGWEQRFCTRCSTQWLTAVVCVATMLVFRIETSLLIWSAVLALSPLPALLDWITQTWGIRESSTLLRQGTGSMLGIGFGFQIVAAVRFDWIHFVVGIGVCCAYSLAIYLLLKIRPARPHYMADLVAEVSQVIAGSGSR